MEPFFRAIAIGLGVLMGTLNPGVSPEFLVNLHKGLGVVVEPLLVRAVSPNMEEALREGVRMSLTVQAGIEGQTPTSVVQTLTYLPLNRQWQVVRRGESPRYFSSLAEAEAAWLKFGELAVGSPPPGPFTLDLVASISFPGRPEWKPDMVWSPPTVSWHKTFTALSEIPY